MKYFQKMEKILTESTESFGSRGTTVLKTKQLLWILFILLSHCKCRKKSSMSSLNILIANTVMYSPESI